MNAAWFTPLGGEGIDQLSPTAPGSSLTYGTFAFQCFLIHSLPSQYFLFHVCLRYLPVLLEHSPFPSPSCSKLSLFSPFFPPRSLSHYPPHPLQCHRFHMAPACDMRPCQNTPDALFNPPLFQPLLNFKQNKRREGGDGGV